MSLSGDIVHATIDTVLWAVGMNMSFISLWLMVLAITFKTVVRGAQGRGSQWHKFVTYFHFQSESCMHHARYVPVKGRLPASELVLHRQ